VAIPAPVKDTLSAFVHVPEYVRRNHVDTTSLHLANRFIPILRRIAGKMKFADNRNPRPAIEFDELVVYRDPFTSDALPSEIEMAPPDCRSRHIEIERVVADGHLCRGRGGYRSLRQERKSACDQITANELHERNSMDSKD